MLTVTGQGYRRIDPELALPALRADMERKLDLIATGKAKVGVAKALSVVVVLIWVA
jgi:DNA topoisomerase IA